MANTKQAKKRMVQSEKRRSHNVSRRSMMRTFLRKTIRAIENKDLDSAREIFQKLQSILDRYATKSLIHKNKVARHKSRLNLKIKFLETQLQSTT